jgi:hypothetical protein
MPSSLPDIYVLCELSRPTQSSAQLSSDSRCQTRVSHSPVPTCAERNRKSTRIQIQNPNSALTHTHTHIQYMYMEMLLDLPCITRHGDGGCRTRLRLCSGTHLPLLSPVPLLFGCGWGWVWVWVSVLASVAGFLSLSVSISRYSSESPFTVCGLRLGGSAELTQHTDVRKR